MGQMELRLSADQRKRVILQAGLKIMKKSGLGHVTFRTVAENTTVLTSISTVKHHFPKRDDLWQAIIDADESGKAAKDAAAMGFDV